MFYLDIGILTRTTRTNKLQTRNEMGVANPLQVNANVLPPRYTSATTLSREVPPRRMGFIPITGPTTALYSDVLVVASTSVNCGESYLAI